MIFNIFVCFSVFHRKGVSIYTPSGTRTIWSYGSKGKYNDKFTCMKFLFKMAVRVFSLTNDLKLS